MWVWGAPEEQPEDVLQEWLCFFRDYGGPMNSRQIDESPKTFILIFESGDELAEGLLQFAKQQKLSAASFKAVGALSAVRLGWFSW